MANAAQVPNWEEAYLRLCESVLEYGVSHDTRAGPATALIGGSLSIRTRAEEFPLLTTRRAYPKPVLGELAAFLRGAQYNEDFVRFGCKYWTANAKASPINQGITDESLLKVGLIYGAMWRNFNGMDQIAEARRMLVEDPDSRRIVVSAWDPTKLKDMCLPPCHILMQWHVLGGQLFLTVYMRSVDLALGLPSDIVLYYALLICMGHDVNLPVGGLVFSFGNMHIYDGHRKGMETQLNRKPGHPPYFKLKKHETPIYLTDLFTPDMLEFYFYRHQGEITYELYA
jgi:thymidylate synthase